MSDLDMALRLVDECQARGVALIAEGGDLTCSGPDHALTSALLDALRIHKPALLRTMGGTTGTGEEPRDGSPPTTSATGRA